MGRHWAWPDDTTPDMVPPDRVAHWLATSAGVTADRAQRWLEPYAQCLKLGQWHSQTTLAAHAWVVAKQAQLREVAPGGGTGAAVPGPSTIPLSATLANQPTTATTSGAATFLLVPNLGIRNPTQDVDVIMVNATMVPQTHDTATVPSASPEYATAMVPQALSVNATAMVPQASSVNVAATVLQASLAYNTPMVPPALSVYATPTVPQALLVNATPTVPQASSVNADVTVPQALSANALTSMDVNATNTSTLTITKADKEAMAKLYS